MINLVSLLVAAALVSLQCGLEAHAQIDKTQMDNHLSPNVIPSPKRRISKFVSIQQPPPETARFTGAPLELHCEVMGVPAPTVQWLKNGEPIADYLDESNEITTIYPSSLAWPFSTLVVTRASSGDVFTCVASTDFATETASTTVYTEEGDDTEALMGLPLFTLPSKPVITLYYIQLFQQIGSNAVLPCRVYSPTEPQIYWQDQSENIIYGNSRIRVLPSGDLFITGVRFSDLGEYTCIAKNLYGKTSATSFLYPLKPKH